MEIIIIINTTFVIIDLYNIQSLFTTIPTPTIFIDFKKIGLIYVCYT